MPKVEIPVDLDSLRTRLRGMNDSELLAFGNQTHRLVYPLSHDGDSTPMSALLIQLNEARDEWWRRYPKMAALNSGDSVRIKNRTGGTMTIEKIERVDGLDIAFCQWFEEERHEVIVLLETLERVLDGPDKKTPASVVSA